uniref:ATP synthase complex subunit 8 n=1 Tax=Cucujoidea sp. 3 KM-2017 TaxID=2219367 RepID=A0A346RH35_9CUCU|nr:ATP synthase F0 subunit 8 [Cucujoidea sp. 3 KM-2017]
MPQMAPLNWLILFIYFLLIFFMVNSMVYFIFKYTPKIKTFNKKNIKYHWKW